MDTVTTKAISARLSSLSMLPLSKVFGYAFLLAIVLAILFPVYWLIVTSLKTQREFFTKPPIFFPTELTLNNYALVLSNTLSRSYLLNTAIVAVLSTVIGTIIGTLAAYALSRVRLPFRLNRILLIWILINRLFPPISLVIPYYLVMRDLRLLDTLVGLVITYVATATPFVVWIMVGFFQDLPKEIERAAMMDGCNIWQRFRLVALPLSVTSMAVTGIFVFMGSWNELLYALTLTSLRAKTVPVAISGYVGDNALAWGEMSAYSVISFIPVFIMAMAVQRYLIRGLSFGAVKE
jgi:multiple sugar transport system permease protein